MEYAFFKLFLEQNVNYVQNYLWPSGWVRCPRSQQEYFSNVLSCVLCKPVVLITEPPDRADDYASSHDCTEKTGLKRKV